MHASVRWPPLTSHPKLTGSSKTDTMVGRFAGRCFGSPRGARNVESAWRAVRVSFRERASILLGRAIVCSWRWARVLFRRERKSVLACRPLRPDDPAIVSYLYALSRRRGRASQSGHALPGSADSATRRCGGTP